MGYKPNRGDYIDPETGWPVCGECLLESGEHYCLEEEGERVTDDICEDCLRHNKTVPLSHSDKSCFSCVISIDEWQRDEDRQAEWADRVDSDFRKHAEEG